MAKDCLDEKGRGRACDAFLHARMVADALHDLSHGRCSRLSCCRAAPDHGQIRTRHHTDSWLCRAAPSPGEEQDPTNGGDWADLPPAGSTQHDRQSGPARQGSRSQLNVGARDYMPPAQSPPPPLPSVAATVRAAAAAPPPPMPPMPPPQRAEEARQQPPSAQSGPPNAAPDAQVRLLGMTQLS